MMSDVQENSIKKRVLCKNVSKRNNEQGCLNLKRKKSGQSNHKKTLCEVQSDEQQTS